jgi:hypothetical protein
MNDNLLKAARRLLDAAEGDHNQMTQTDAGHYEFELDLAIRCFKDAHKEYMEQQAAPLAEPTFSVRTGCRVCGVGDGGKAMGYVCPRSDCPMRVTCGGTV